MSDKDSSQIQSERVLVIDDEPGIRQGCQRALSSQEFRVDTAANGEEGLQLIRQHLYDLVLIDVMMPGINGIELISLIHEQDPDTVCLVITGYATVELAVSAIKEGAYDFLTKPFTTDELLLAVNQGLEHRHLRKESQRLQFVELEARRLEAERLRLEELDRSKAAFIRLVTHELKSPVNAIITYLDLIQGGYIESQEIPKYLSRCQERAQEVLELISDLLRYGRMKELHAEGQVEPVNVGEILEQVIRQYEPEAQEKGIGLTIQISPDLQPVQSTVDEVQCLWSNLLSNALKYTMEGGKIDVSLQKAGASREVSHQVMPQLVGQVRDTGIGIPEEEQNRLFSEFFRARNAKSLNIAGTGLGLAIVRQIVEKMGGEISVESELNRGTCFTFRLPISEPVNVN